MDQSKRKACGSDDSEVSCSSDYRDVDVGEIEDLFATASTLIAKTNKFLTKIDTVLNKIHHNVQDYKSLDSLQNVQESLKCLNKAVDAIEESRRRRGETKVFVLSPEMVDAIMEYLSFRDKKMLRLVSRSMYDLVTPHDKRFYVWRIDLNKGCPMFGRILDKVRRVQLHITLHKSSASMAKFIPHIEKASDRIVELVATSTVIRKMPDTLKIMNQLENLSISYCKVDDEFTTRVKAKLNYPPLPDQDYNDVMPILQRNSNSLKTLYLSHFIADRVKNTGGDFKLKALKDLHLCKFEGDLDLASDVIVSKCKESLESLTLSEVCLQGRKPQEISRLVTLKKLTVEQKNFCLSWSLPIFLKYVCPGITKLVLNSVHFPDEMFLSKLVVEEMYIHNCRIDNISSLLNACSSTLKTLQIRQDEEFDDSKIFYDYEYEFDMNGPFCLIKTMVKQEFRLRYLQDLTLMTDYFDAEKMSNDLKGKLPASVTIQIKSPYYD